MEQPNGRLASAMAYAALIHGTQKRKGTKIPYVSHLMSVSALVMEFGGDEDQAIAGMLHDALEDVGPEHEAIIRTNYGARVADIVRACTDGKPGEKRDATNWRERKEDYLRHLASANAESLLVSACDKLHNSRAIAADLRAGRDVFRHFNGSKDDTLWYYRRLLEIFQTRLGPDDPVVKELAVAVESIHSQAR